MNAWHGDAEPVRTREAESAPALSGLAWWVCLVAFALFALPVLAATVLCGELSLLAAQTNPGELMAAHLRLERGN